MYRDAERHYVEGRDWEGAVRMYREQSMWEEAIRVAKVNGGVKASRKVHTVLSAGMLEQKEQQ